MLLDAQLLSISEYEKSSSGIFEGLQPSTFWCRGLCLLSEPLPSNEEFLSGFEPMTFSFARTNPYIVRALSIPPVSIRYVNTW